MEFFTADDVLDHGVSAAPDEPVTVASDASIQRALTVMLENDYDQLPVTGDDGVEGTVTYESVAKYVSCPRVNSWACRWDSRVSRSRPESPTPPTF